MKRILAAIDFSDVTDAIVDAAIELARALGGEVRLIHTEVPAPMLVGYDEGALPLCGTAEATEVLPDQGELDALKQRVSDSGVPVQSVLIEGPPVSKILDEARDWHADVLVVGTHRHGKLFHLLFGSVHEGIIHKASCPVMVVPGSQ